MILVISHYNCWLCINEINQLTLRGLGYLKFDPSPSASAEKSAVFADCWSQSYDVCMVLNGPPSLWLYHHTLPSLLNIADGHLGKAHVVPGKAPNKNFLPIAERYSQETFLQLTCFMWLHSNQLATSSNPAIDLRSQGPMTYARCSMTWDPTINPAYYPLVI